MSLYLIPILFALTILGQGTNLYPQLPNTNLYQQQPNTNLYQQQPKLIQSSQAEALLAQSSSNAAVLSSQASSTAQAASIAAARTASIASALTGNGALSSYPYQLNCDSLLDWSQFAVLAWELGSNSNFDLWASKQFNNAWIGDLGMVSPVQLQLPSWVDSSSQSQWNVWAQILSAQRNLNAMNSLNMANGLGSNSAWLLQNGGGLSASANGLLASSTANGLLASSLANGANGLLASSLANGANGLLSSSLSNGANGLLASSFANGANGLFANGANGLLASSLANGANGLLASSFANGANGLLASSLANTYNGLFVGSQPSGSGPWSGHYTGWTQNNGVWYGDTGAGWYKDSNGDWYTLNSYAGSVGNGISASVNGVYVGPQPTGSGPWSGQTNGWTQNNGWWYNGNGNGNGWYKDTHGNWYKSNSNSNTGSGLGIYVGPQPTGSGPWSGQTNGWTQNNGWWYNSNGNGNGWYKDNQGNWYTSNSNGNTGSGYGIYVGPQPTGSGPWSGQVNGWTQNNGWWYNSNGNGWYKDNQGNWYTSNNNGNTGSGYGNYVGPQPTGSGPWSGQYTGWTQNNGWWYNGNGNGWYKDTQGNWYTSNNGNTGSGYGNTVSGYGVYVGPQPTGTGPWSGQTNGWTQNNGWWYNSNGNGWYKDTQGNWYTSNSNGNTGSGLGIYVGPQPTGSGPWNGQYTGWTQNNGWWYNGNDNGWYKDNQGNWYMSNSNGNTGSGLGIYVGPVPTGSGPWNGQYTGWTQNKGWWYNGNGNGWYKDNQGNWYMSNSNGNTGSGYGNTGSGYGIYVGPQPTGSGPWNGQYTGWTQRDGRWYNSLGVGWYQDSNGNWYTTSTSNQMAIGFGEGGAGSATTTQCVSTTAGQMNATLSCPPSTVVVSVLGAAYGNNPGSCPSNVNTMNPTCTLNVTQLIQKTCQGQNQCSITVQPNILGAPTNNGQQCSTAMNGAMNAGPYSTSNQFTLVARYTCGIAGPGGFGLNSTSLTFTPPNSASSSSYSPSLILALLIAAMLVL